MADDLPVKIVLSDGSNAVLEIPESVAKKSELFAGVIDNMDPDDEDCDRSIPIVDQHVTKAIMEKAIEYLTYIKDHPEPKINQPLENNDLSKNVDDQWYVNYITYENEQDERCYELMLVASLLNVQSLLQLASAKVATMIWEMTIEQKR